MASSCFFAIARGDLGAVTGGETVTANPSANVRTLEYCGYLDAEIANRAKIVGKRRREPLGPLRRGVFDDSDLLQRDERNKIFYCPKPEASE